MSRFTPEMDRDGIQWQEPVGTWKQGQDIVHLATIAEKLVIPPDRENTDLLNSIPTPWSRLLLFESALYNEQHPSHADVLDQWRGLLGLLALANPLGIDVRPGAAAYTVRLQDFAAEHAVAKSFADLRPRYEANGEDAEAGKWDQFHLIVVGDSLLGATSSRTLVFTAIDHRCPPTVPFQNAHRRLSDPLRYFKRFGDRKYLGLLRRWLDNFTTAVEGNVALRNWLGTLPAPPRMAAPWRQDKLLALLRQWRAEVVREAPAGATPQTGPLAPLFTLTPYNSLTFLPAVPPSGLSDLLLATEAATKKKVLVCFRPARGQNPKTNSLLYNEHGQVVQADPLLIYDGRWTTADGVLPDELDFLPADWAYISDPVAELFEEHIVEVKLPEAEEDKGGAYALSAGQKTFLFPFKNAVLEYFTPEELFRFASVEIEPDQGYRVTLELPLVGGRTVRASRLYEDGSRELVLVNNSALDHLTSELAMWPGFADERWGYYFYFKQQLAPKNSPERNLDFAPVGGELPRSDSNNAAHWYFTTRPARAFVGTVAGKSGLLLPRYEELPPQTDRDYWNVAVDFGSTHTRVFYVRMRKDDSGNYASAADAAIEKLEFSAHARQVTKCDPERLKNDFFALSGKLLDPPSRVELKTLLVQPVSDPVKYADWRPREGFSLIHWIHGGFEDKRLRSDIKWESSGNRNDLNSYLRCLMVMVQAEAARRNAEVVFVARSYPTAFNNRLKADHNTEWVALGSFMNMRVESEPEKIISEAVATARYLGSKSAPQMSNTVSLDIGGSTTDVAIWYGKHVRGDRGGPLRAVLGVQESVKLAAGSLGRYLESDPNARRFLEWFVQTVKRQGVLKDLSLDSFAGRRHGYALMFYNILSYYELAGERLRSEYNALLGQIKVQEEARGLLMHLIYLFGSLTYYAGLLARKVGLQEQKRPVYYLYFCGKGGTLVTWINNHQRFAERLFLAGLYGPDGADGAASPPLDEAEAPPRASVDVRLSPEPKEEVGRGLLAPLTLRGGEDDDGSFGLVDTRPDTVTAGETGYKVRDGGATRELLWSDNLDRAVLRSLDGELPAFRELKELNCFIGAIREAYKNQEGGDALYDFGGLLSSEREKHSYIDQLTTRLLGDDEGCVLHDLEQENNPNALVEPLLVTEMKVLLEMLAGNDKIFK
jgi:hypothetical protein